MGTAEPMMTAGAGEAAVATMRGPLGGAASEEASCLGVPFLAESAAKGETKVGRAAGADSGRRPSESDATWFEALPTIAGLAGGFCPLAAGAVATSLSHCSMGSSFWAWAILSSPSSRWKRCSCLYPSSLWVQIFLAKPLGNAGDALAFFTGNLQQGRIFAGDLGDCGGAQETHHLAGEMRGTVALADQVIDLAKNFFTSSLRHSP